MQFQSDLLQIPIEQPSIIESTALGVAGLAGITVNFWTKEYFLTPVKSIRNLCPNAILIINTLVGKKHYLNL